MTDLVFKDSEAITEALGHANYIEKLKSALDRLGSAQNGNMYGKVHLLLQRKMAMCYMKFRGGKPLLLFTMTD